MFSAIGALVVVAIVVVLVLSAQKPDTFSVKRSAVIAAAPERIYPLLDDFHRWAAWSPWEHRDPAMRRDFSGPQSGPGATYAWSGNKEVGQGRMEILQSEPFRQLRIKLDFIKPFEGHNVAVFTLAPQGAGTEVLWEMSGPSTWIMKIMQVFMNMDTMVGRDFEAGLGKLAVAAMAPPA